MPEIRRATAAATSIAGSLGLSATDAIVLHNSNKLALRLTPCDVFARVAPIGQEVAQFEVELAQRLAEVGAPVATLEPRVDPVVHTRDGFAITLWTYYEPAAAQVPAADYANALEQLHLGMRKVDLASPRFSDRTAAAEAIVGNPDLSPELSDADRVFLLDTLRSAQRAIDDRGPAEQLLHGEPHPGNLLSTANGPLFIDLETCCRGPVELDLAHAPEAVCENYPDIDQGLLDDCRQLVLALVAAWRWDIGDQFPNGLQWREEFLRTLRAGPPWPTLDTMASRLDAPQKFPALPDARPRARRTRRGTSTGDRAQEIPGLHPPFPVPTHHFLSPPTTNTRQRTPRHRCPSSRGFRRSNAAPIHDSVLREPTKRHDSA